MKKSILTFVLILLAIWTICKADPITIKGKVTSKEDNSALPGASIIIKGTTKGAVANAEGKYEITVPSEKTILIFSYIGFLTVEIEVKKQRVLNVQLESDLKTLNEVVVTGYATQKRMDVTGAVASEKEVDKKLAGKTAGVNVSSAPFSGNLYIQDNTEEYSLINENTFHESTKEPLSTFSIDVDKASYSNVRRFIQDGQTPPIDAVRIEELINYFTYEYKQPENSDPFSINTEMAICPWNKDHRLVQIGLQGKNISTENLPASNLVFLIDVSGSMSSSEKLPLLKSGFKLLIDQLRPRDEVSIVVYAGAAGVVLEPTSGKEETKILEALERLEAGGSTAGGAGINLAYEIAKRNFKENGNNRIILATDGDFNVGVSGNGELERLIEEKRETGIFLSVLGFGMGNYKDSKMEILADKGNGNYAYIDNLLEAKKVFVNEFGGTLFTIAKDVKIQVEFNPAKVRGYRLVGYENRALNNEDFNDDKKDAGELGSGHAVTALYEIIPTEVENSPYLKKIDKLKYQSEKELAVSNSKDICTVKLRYKKPDGNQSKLIEKTINDELVTIENASSNLRFAASVASFGMLLRNSEFKGTSTYADVLSMGKTAIGKDDEGYRAEFLNMVRSMQLLAKQ
jgi:Ca-activated chloride channel homolog